MAWRTLTAFRVASDQIRRREAFAVTERSFTICKIDPALYCESECCCRQVIGESVESRSQFVRHRQLGCVIGVELNDIGAPVLGDHRPLQRRRDGRSRVQIT
jgi:hypothetical protein